MALASNSDRGLTAAEAAARLGVKRQTLYAYVSRGLLARTVASDGRTSLFDPAEVDRVRQGRKPETDGELHTLIATGLTLVDDRGLRIRGRDLVELVAAGATFTDAVDLLWDSAEAEGWVLPPHTADDDAGPAHLDTLRVIVARHSAADPLRDDLSPKSVRAVGRSLITAMATNLTPRQAGEDASIPSALWRRLTKAAADQAQLTALDAALALVVDHGLASSTFAARIAASVRADPYSVVSAGLGVLGGPLHGAASGAVHELFAETERTGDASAAAGAARRRLGGYPGFGHTVYKVQDPRYGALMGTIVEAWGDDPRLVNVYRVRDVIGERSDAIPNLDLALGALTYLAGMPVDGGEVIFAVSRTAGWLAHAMEEYDEKPLRFRPKARYTGQ